MASRKPGPGRCWGRQAWPNLAPGRAVASLRPPSGMLRGSTLSALGALLVAGVPSLVGGCLPGWCDDSSECRPDELCAWDHRCVARDGSSDGDFFPDPFQLPNTTPDAGSPQSCVTGVDQS